MSILLCLTGLLIAAINVDGKVPKKITGGSEAGEGEFPYQVGLKVRKNVLCGGSIIDSRHILTAAHCVHDLPVDPTKEMIVVTGTNDILSGDGVAYNIQKVWKHPSYAPSAWRNDIAILTLTEDVEFNERTKPVELPTSADPGDVVAVASGWGDSIYPNPKNEIPAKLQKIELRVVPKGSCTLPRNLQVHSGQLCAVFKRGSGLCTGDSGGPLVYDGKVIGIASFVYKCGLGYPDVFTRVFEYLDWIKSVTNKL
ncbi:chymotrypsin-2-like [Venturia canescens]|uniref:chymotrypsin-2-like n=1 Tax=Venturia canescens TaxID=32260 RepID=UPI001C9C8A45|nr:chymotrypsin-2-like [Venturia canescens]